MNSYCYYKIVIAHLTFHDIWSPPNGNNGLLCRELRRIWLTKLSAKLSWAEACELDTVQDFLIKLGIKLRLHILKISIFSLNHVIIRPTKIMNNLLKVCKICTFKVIFWHQKSTESFWFFSVKNIWLRDKLLQMNFFENFDLQSTLLSKIVPNFCRLCS